MRTPINDKTNNQSLPKKSGKLTENERKTQDVQAKSEPADKLQKQTEYS
jgi:hypothetical protein